MADPYYYMSNAGPMSYYPLWNGFGPVFPASAPAPAPPPEPAPAPDVKALTEDSWINTQAASHPLSALEDCAIAIDATYYLKTFLDNAGSHEPLLPALGGLTGFKKHLEADLDQWEAHQITPFFIFDGQPLKGQDDVSITKGRRANEKTDAAWDLYFNNRATESVAAFSVNIGGYRTEKLYPLLQGLLKKRQLHFVVAPYNAAAQIASLDMMDSDQCAGIMGSHELFLYPIHDCVIRSMNWHDKTATAISKQHLLTALNTSESLFVDALLVTGTTFLPTFPPLLDQGLYRTQPPSIIDALSVLRTYDRSVTAACASFGDIVQRDDKDWLDKFRQARMAVSHFIYIAESGEVKVHDYDHLTKDNFEYLGLQLPPELFHYLNTGLIGPRILSWITHLQIAVLPTIDGVASEEYKKLVASQVVPIKEQALGLVTSRLSRGISHRVATMRVWYDPRFQHVINLAGLSSTSSAPGWAGWDIKESVLKDQFPQFSSGSIASELLALRNSDVAKSTVAKGKVRDIKSADSIVSLTIWRLLQLRGYINDSHTLTNWGNALAVAMKTLRSTVQNSPAVPHLYEALLVAFELIRFDLLNVKNKHEELQGMPVSSTDEDQACLLLISRCATLLKLRHEANGYTGPLSKNLLHFRSLASEVRSADRDLTEALVANMFTLAVADRDRTDNWDLSQRLPFLADPNVALGIAVKTYLNDVRLEDSSEERTQKKEAFPGTFVPYATHFSEDLAIAFQFFDAIYAGVKTLEAQELPAADRAAWDKASEYLGLRR